MVKGRRRPPPRRFQPHNLREIREVRGLTTTELGNRTGYSYATVIRVELGEQPLKQPFLDRAAAVLGVTRGQILDGPIPDPKK